MVHVYNMRNSKFYRVIEICHNDEGNFNEFAFVYLIWQLARQNNMCICQILIIILVKLLGSDMVIVVHRADGMIVIFSDCNQSNNPSPTDTRVFHLRFLGTGQLGSWAAELVPITFDMTLTACECNTHCHCQNRACCHRLL